MGFQPNPDGRYQETPDPARRDRVQVSSGRTPCPLFEFPKNMTSNANCDICAHCIKSCPNDSIQLTVRPPTKELWFIRKPKMEEAFLSAVIMGIVFVQNVTMLEVWTGMLNWLERVTGTTNYAVTSSIAFTIAIAIPVLLPGLTSWIASKFNKTSLVENFTRFGYAIIALDVAGHAAHNLFHPAGRRQIHLLHGHRIFRSGSSRCVTYDRGNGKVWGTFCLSPP